MAAIPAPAPARRTATARLALGVTIAAGTLLNTINLAGSLLGDSKIDRLKLGRTDVIPYCVATHGAVYEHGTANRPS